MATLSDYRERKHWSYSALNQFFNICSLQYAFERVYRLPKAFTPVSLGFGSAFHRVMEWAALTRMHGHHPSADDAAALFQDVWARQLQEDRDIKFDEGEDSDTCAAMGRGMCACIVNKIDPEERVLSVSEAFCAPLVLADGETLETPLIGEIDLVVEKQGEVLLVDWKTSAKRWPKAKADRDWQPTAFCNGYAFTHGLLPGFRFDVVTKAKTPALERHVTARTADDFVRLAEHASLAESMIQAGHFCPNEMSFFCGGCPYREPCRNWHRQRSRVAVRMAA